MYIQVRLEKEESEYIDLLRPGEAESRTMYIQVSLEKEESEYIDLLRPGEAESGTVYDIVVREHICLR